MKDNFTDVQRNKVYVDFSENCGTICFKNHSFGVGGVNSMPMPENIISGVQKLQPRLIRIFIQEFFFITMPDDDFNLDFSRLDPYMKSIRDTGADIMASICVKPEALFPVVDENIWKPNDIQKWQYLISEMVKRYDYVTYWGVGNEMNIGEYGGCPYKINDVNDYFEYYKMTSDAILNVRPNVKIGGPSLAGIGDGVYDFLNKFVGLCTSNSVKLDFISYNIYSDDFNYHIGGASAIRDIASKHDIEVYVTEMNIGIGGEVSIEEKAYHPKRAAALASIILEYNEKVPDIGTFQYHIFDQFCDPNEFKPFYSRHRYMANHWNDEPHRLGLFDLDGNPRPQYHMYNMLNELASNRVKASVDNADIRIIASHDDENEKITVFMTNYNIDTTSDSIVSLYFTDCFEDTARLKVQRIDSKGFKTTEDRFTYIHSDFWFSVYTPADSCVLITITRSSDSGVK